MTSKIFYSTKEANVFLRSGAAVTIGNFDGVHIGHQKILKNLMQIAQKKSLKSVLLTFDPHPVKILSPEAAPPLINTLKQKLEILKQTKLDAIVVQKFDKNFAKLSAYDFFTKVLKNNLCAEYISVGYDFTFGFKRSGTTERLEKWGQENAINVHITPAILQGEALLSSTFLRKLIGEGKIKAAKKYLGRDFFIEGNVVPGFKRGTSLGLHTANLKTYNELLPLDGVYATFVTMNGKTYQSATNIGFNPTYHNSERSIEVHIFNFDQEIYGETLRLTFMDRIRDEIQFASADILVQQIKKDIATAKKILK